MKLRIFERHPMLARKLYSQLLEWKSQAHRKALLLVGPRQVGKSTLVEKLGKEEYGHLVTINLALNDAARDALAHARDVDDFLRRVSLFSSGPMPFRNTLVFIDEVQELPNVMTMAKALVEDGRYDYVFSGSMLGTEFKGVRSYPVGYVRELHMSPMDFEEFLWSAGASEAAQSDVRDALVARRPVPAFLHDAMLAYFRTYVVVGGMPEVVQRFVDTGGDLAAVRQTQEELVRAYRRDIGRYAGTRRLNVTSIFDQLPLQLDKDSRRFVLNSVDDDARFSAYRQDFVWLVNAGVALKCNLVREPKEPLEATERPGMFKLYQSDTGMLVSRYSREVARNIYLDAREPNLGGVYENVIAQQLATCDCKLFYYMGKKRGEVDFVVSGGRGQVVPLEVKSGRNARAHAALNNLLAMGEYDISQGVVVSRLNVEQEGRVLYLPWYAMGWIDEVLNPNAAGGVDQRVFLELPKI